MNILILSKIVTALLLHKSLLSFCALGNLIGSKLAVMSQILLVKSMLNP